MDREYGDTDDFGEIPVSRDDEALRVEKSADSTVSDNGAASTSPLGNVSSFHVVFETCLRTLFREQKTDKRYRQSWSSETQQEKTSRYSSRG